MMLFSLLVWMISDLPQRVLTIALEQAFIKV